MNIFYEKTAILLALLLIPTQARVHDYGISEPLTLAGKTSANVVFNDKTKKRDIFVV